MSADDFFTPARTAAEQLSELLEHATDAYVNACVEAAEAENMYLRAYHVGWAEATVDGVAATVRSKSADNRSDVVEAKCAWNLAVAREKACRAKCDELKNRLVAALSHQKMVGAQV